MIPDRDVAWIAGGHQPDPQQATIYRTCLRRHRQGRVIGGLTGIAVGLIVIFRWDDDWTITIGVAPMPSNIIMWWLCGVVIGNLLAESYHLSRTTSGVRRAGLDPRSASPLPKVVRTARIAAVLAIVVGIVGVAVWKDLSALPGLVCAVVIVGFAETARRVITDRPRPTTDPAITVDDRLRWFSASSLAWLELAGTVLGLAIQIQFLSSHGSAHSGLFVVVASCANIALLVITIVAIFRSRMAPPRRWQPLTVSLTSPMGTPT